jgi:hypothetical protein
MQLFCIQNATEKKIRNICNITSEDWLLQRFYSSKPVGGVVGFNSTTKSKVQSKEMILTSLMDEGTSCSPVPASSQPPEISFW